MTPEERLTKIENAIQALTEVQAKHDSGIRELIVISKILVESQQRTDDRFKAFDDRFEAFMKQQQRTDDRINALIEHEQKLDRKLIDLHDIQRQTEQKLNLLIDTVDRFIRGRNGKLE